MKDFAKELKDLDFIPRAMGRVLIRGAHDWIFLGQVLDLLESQLSQMSLNYKMKLKKC